MALLRPSTAPAPRPCPPPPRLAAPPRSAPSGVSQSSIPNRPALLPCLPHNATACSEGRISPFFLVLSSGSQANYTLIRREHFGFGRNATKLRKQGQVRAFRRENQTQLQRKLRWLRKVENMKKKTQLSSEGMEPGTLWFASRSVSSIPEAPVLRHKMH